MKNDVILNVIKVDLHPSASDAQNCRYELWAQGEICMYAARGQNLVAKFQVTVTKL